MIWQHYERWFPESDRTLDEYAEVLTLHCDLGVYVCVCVGVCGCVCVCVCGCVCVCV